MKSKISDDMSYREFLDRYLINHEEFVFYYKEMEINFCYGANGSFLYNIVKNGVKILEKEFKTPYELLQKIEIDGAHFPELWDVIE